MLCADGTKPDAHCDVEVAWFADCNNPENNDPNKCLNHYGDWFQGVNTPLSDAPQLALQPAFKLLSGADTFAYQAPADILKADVTVANQSIRYGNAYVYFAACAGKLYPAPGLTDRLPVQCRDRDTGALLDQRRFVVGVTTIYAYDNVRNENPVILRHGFDRQLSRACNGDNPCEDGSTCMDDGQCVPVVAPCRDSERCAPHCFSINVAPSSFVMEGNDGTPLTAAPKSLWVEYYTNAGSVPDDARFGLGQPQESDRELWYCASWQPPTSPTDDARIWLVLRDDRGGLTWRTQRIIVR
jgi:hypothetical protein